MEKILSYTTPPTEHGIIIRTILQSVFGLSTKQISQAKFRHGGITVNGKKQTVRYELQPGDVLKVCLEEAESGSHQLVPMYGEVSICYEDDDLVFVNKPSGIVVHPSPGHYCDTLVNLLVGHYLKMGLSVVTRPLGRLDKDTSGLICFSKNTLAAARLEQARNNGLWKRQYLAFVVGTPFPLKGQINAPIGPTPGVLMKRMIRLDGQEAITDYEVLQTFGDYSLVTLTLHTGRTHQIRLHMASIGHPLLGDSLYGEINKKTAWESLSHAALHSWKITGTHPITGEPISLTCELPPDLLSLMN